MIQINNMTFTYGGESAEAGGIREINLEIADGEFVVLCSESGCGKTTITRLINGLISHYYEGEMDGSVQVNGNAVSEQPLYDTAKIVGSVFQNPRSQFFNVDTTGEISFGCENLGMPEEEIRSRMDKTVKTHGLEKLMNRSIFKLSGGEKQKIACAGVFVMEPEVFGLDEPSSNLDAASISELREILGEWKKQGKTIVLSEHRLYYLRGLADRFIFVKAGRIARDYRAEEFEALTEEERREMGLRSFALEQLKAPAGRIVGIIGNNGAGKSTFSRCFCGLEKRCGEIEWQGKTYRPKDRLNTCYMVMQDVNHQLFTESVLDEVLISMEDEDEKRAEEILDSLDLLPLKERHPMSLSGGQKQCVAIASAIASKRSVLFFDEPTSGLDYKHMLEVAQVLRQLQQSGKTIYVITHDLELILACCTDIIYLAGGQIKDSYPVDERGLTQIREYFIKGVSSK